MSINLSKLVRDHFNAVEKKDLEVVLGFYHPDINFIDPHYPKVNMKGKNEVIKGLTWSFKTVKSFSFSTINYFEMKTVQMFRLNMIRQSNCLMASRFNSDKYLSLK